MRHYEILTLLVTNFLRLTCCDKTCHVEGQLEPVSKTMMGGHVFMEFTVSSKFQCLDFCMRNRHCRSFNILHIQGRIQDTCELNSIGWSESKSGEVFANPNSEFYDISSDKIAQVTWFHDF